ncbi:bifunctional glutamate N-acetyltransferase/amino-acid acetyltransferase ArgJ [Candidatus Woesearchaeota archaeon]|nr:bifunctional glutamate N-acetyltransferase/amino-acid acetyltransferase ArgJ [Candidatus Woesearchaeota archaeon]
MKIIGNGVNAVDGITSIGKSIGIKKLGKLDFAVIYSDKPCTAAAIYTSNNVKGAPLLVTKNHLRNGKAQAIAANSGIANVCTGKKGMKDAEEMAKLAASELGIKKTDVLVASTGLIGAYLPMEKIRKGINGIKNELSKNSRVAEAIMTTDTKKKEIAVEVDNFRIGGIAKGSGMIHPNMATMLCFITTDAKISSPLLNKILKESANESFNMMCVDTDTSTSDMAVVMSTCMVKADLSKFKNALSFVCKELAKKIAADGEGATKLLIVKVKNALKKEDARKIAKSVISSNLVKCAFYGNDPNWGRLMCAIGNSGAHFIEQKVNVKIEGIKIVENGRAAALDIELLKRNMQKKELGITIDLGLGIQEATAYGCDMGTDYVKINALYRT